MTEAHPGAPPGAIPREDPRDLIARYACERLAVRCEIATAERYRSWLEDVYVLTGEAGLLTADIALAAAAIRASGRPQDRWKAIRIGAVLDDFRQWAAGH